MTEVVVAVYTTASAAETAAADLEVARVPTTTIRQFVSDSAAEGELLEVRNWRTTSGDGRSMTAMRWATSLCTSSGNQASNDAA